MSIARSLEKEGIFVSLDGDELVVRSDHELNRNERGALRMHKRHLIDQLHRQQIAAAIKRLELGECDAVRLRSSVCDGDILLLRDDVIPGSIEVDVPSFSLGEIKRLVGATPEQIRKVYLVKQRFPGSEVVDHA